MTTSTTADYEHPEWCDQSLCAPYPMSSVTEGEHLSSGSKVGLQGWEAEALVQLVLLDDIARG